jgi:hypothetical protein
VIAATGRCLATVGSVPTAPVAAASLVLGFAVAQASGVRALGGLVLLAGLVWCAVRWRRRAGTGAAIALAGVYAAAFVLSHVLAGAIGAWGSVAVAAAAVAGAAWVVADARAAGAVARA